MSAPLDALVEDQRTEHVMCLLGVQRQDTIFIQAMVSPVVHRQRGEDVSADFDGCRGSGIWIGVWHTHPLHQATVWGVLLAASLEPKEACYLSSSDVHAALDQPAGVILQVVQVDPATLCWWTREQILHAHAERPGGFIYPLRGQYQGW